MIIDFHSHIGESDKLLNFQTKREVTIDDVINVQLMAGISSSVALPLPLVYKEDVDAVNHAMMGITNDRLFPFVCVNPFYLKSTDRRGIDEASLTRKIKESRIYGIKVHPVCDGYYPHKRLMSPVLEIAEACSVPVLWHTGWGSFGEARYIDYVAADFTNVHIVVGHLVDNNAPDIARRHDNVYLETSYCSGPRRLAGVVNQVGPEKILFGSDFPVNNPVVQKELVLQADISDSDKEKILGLNAKRLLRL